MPYELGIPSGEYRFSGAEGWMRLQVWKDGMLSRLGHDLTLALEEFELVATVAEGSDSIAFRLAIPVSSFSVLEPASMLDAMKREVQQNIRKHLPGDIRVEGTLQPVSASQVKLQAEAVLGGKRTPLSMVCRWQGGQLTGSTKLTHRQFHLKPFKAPLGVLKIKDEMDFSFRFDWKF